jgi:hypothetical protein
MYTGILYGCMVLDATSNNISVSICQSIDLLIIKQKTYSSIIFPEISFPSIAWIMVKLLLKNEKREIPHCENRDAKYIIQL